MWSQRCRPIRALRRRDKGRGRCTHKRFQWEILATVAHTLYHCMIASDEKTCCRPTELAQRRTAVRSPDLRPAAAASAWWLMMGTRWAVRQHLSEQKVSNSSSFSVSSSAWRQKVKVLWRSVAVPQVSVRLRLQSFQSFKKIFLQGLEIGEHVFYSLFFHLSELKNKNSPRSNLKFRFDKLSHSAAVSPSMWESRSLSNAWQDTGWLWLSLKISCGGV